MTPEFPSLSIESLKYQDVMDKTEKEYLQSLYARTNGNIKQVIEYSGISRAVLYRKLKKHNIK